jgi:myo-inositol-1(or 4)-monophosphatase
MRPETNNADGAGVPDLANCRAFLHELAAASGEFIRPYFANPHLAVDTKADQSPVTLADRGAEEVLRTLIRQKYPTHGILGEEFGADRTDAEWVWVLDPIDGTKAFLERRPGWATLIALLHRGQPVLGAIHQPVLANLMIGDGHETTMNGQVVHCRPTTRLAEATMVVSDLAGFGKYRGGADYTALSRRAHAVRDWSDGYGYLLIAAGQADVCVDPDMKPWDIAPLVPIIRGAGGVITDWSGGPAYPAVSSVVSGHPALHAEVLAVLKF